MRYCWRGRPRGGWPNPNLNPNPNPNPNPSPNPNPTPNPHQVWHPALTPEEREALVTLFALKDRFTLLELKQRPWGARRP